MTRIWFSTSMAILCRTAVYSSGFLPGNALPPRGYAHGRCSLGRALSCGRRGTDISRFSPAPCNLPATAQAYSMNFTSVPSGPLNFLTTWPAGQTQPLVSTLNAGTGAVTANSAIVPAGTNGDISVFVTDNADLVIDVNGYFAPPVAGGLSLYALTPCRVLDTRNSPVSRHLRERSMSVSC